MYRLMTVQPAYKDNVVTLTPQNSPAKFKLLCQAFPNTLFSKTLTIR